MSHVTSFSSDKYSDFARIGTAETVTNDNQHVVWIWDTCGVNNAGLKTYLEQFYLLMFYKEENAMNTFERQTVIHSEKH